MKKVVICLIVILIIAILGVGGWFLFDNLQKEKITISVISVIDFLLYLTVPFPIFATAFNDRER